MKGGLVSDFRPHRRTPLHVAFTPPVETFCARRFGVDSKGLPLAKKPDGDVSDMEWIRPGSAEDRQKIVARSRRPASVPSLDATRVHLTMTWVVYFSISSQFIRVETAIRAGRPSRSASCSLIVRRLVWTASFWRTLGQ